MKSINIIVAVANNGAIGDKGNLLWHIGEDLRYFKATTLNSTVIMGRKTWESLPFKPLKHRRNIVITSNANFEAKDAQIVTSFEAALAMIGDDETAFCIGGGKVYEQFMPFCNRIYLTKVYADFDADTFFPIIDEQDFELESSSEIFTDANNNLRYRFEIYKRR
ncbi:MAG: dihydrofolate reductase [Bacteroidales bacterium]|jgi:dihydrofolate reductase|nr:dihydrofolate reductase [Bacteroidales bacterium]